MYSYTLIIVYNTWKIEKIDKRIYASIVHASDFYRTHIYVHSIQRINIDF